MWKNALLIILISLIGALAAMIYVGVVGRVTNYAANATLFSAAYGSYEDSSSGVTVMNTYSSLIGTSRVCERAAEQLGEYGITSDVLKNMVKSGSIYVIGASSDSRSYSYRINVYVTSRSPERVVAITNAMADSLANELNDFLGTRTIQVMDEAESYYSYQSINLLTYMSSVEADRQSVV